MAISETTILATALHRLGSCGSAAQQGGQAWSDWRHTHGSRNPAAITIAVPYLAILVACERTVEALRVLGQLGPALPPRGNAKRHAFADWATAMIAATAVEHRPVCARRLDTFTRSIFPTTAAGHSTFPGRTTGANTSFDGACRTTVTAALYPPPRLELAV